MSKQADYVLRTVQERGIRFIRLWFTDVQGFLKSVSISPQELETACEEGMTFDGSAIEGYSRVQESDVLAVPDASTFEIVPWRGDEAPVAERGPTRVRTSDPSARTASRPLRLP